MTPRWNVIGFEDRLDEWIELEEPDQDLVVVVGMWILSRMDNPYEDARREEGFEDLWFVEAIPGTHRGDMVVTCVYWINPDARQVQCDRFSSLSWPT